MHRTLISLCAGAIALACAAVWSAPPSHAPHAARPVTPAQAAARIAALVRSPGPEVRRAPPPRVVDITPPGLRQGLGGQVFQLTEPREAGGTCDAWFVTRRAAVPLTLSFGGWGLMSLCPCPAPGGPRPSIALTYSWGSGIHRSHVRVFRPGDTAAPGAEREFVMRDVDLVLEPRAGGIDVVACVWDAERRRPARTIERIGQLTVGAGKGGAVCGVRLRPGLSAEMRRRIWRTPRSVPAP